MSPCQHKAKKSRRFLPLLFCSHEPRTGTALIFAQAVVSLSTQASICPDACRWSQAERIVTGCLRMCCPAATWGECLREGLWAALSIEDSVCLLADVYMHGRARGASGSTCGCGCGCWSAGPQLLCLHRGFLTGHAADAGSGHASRCCPSFRQLWRMPCSRGCQATWKGSRRADL